MNNKLIFYIRLTAVENIDENVKIDKFKHHMLGKSFKIAGKNKMKTT